MRPAATLRIVAGLAACLAWARPAAAGERLALPDVALMDSSGRAVRLRSELIGERVVALQFVFTRCAAICPAMGSQFKRVQALLGGTRARLISVSIDPEHDTPERMAAWGKPYGAGGAWTLLTGQKDEITRLQKACGVFAAEPARHTPTVVVFDGASGRFTRVSGLAPPEAVAEAIRHLADGRRDSQ